MNSFERNIEIKDKVSVIELEKSLLVKSDIKSELINKNFILNKADAGHWENNIFGLHKIDPHYIYLSDTTWDFINKSGFYREKSLEVFYNGILDPFEAFKLNNFNEDKIVKFDYGSYLLYKLNEVNPISMPYSVGYIGGITDDKFNLQLAEEVLKNNPDILWLNYVDIPYYNRDNNTTALEFKVKLPQETHDALCNYYRDVVKDKFWMCRVKDALVWRPWFENDEINLDILELKKCYIGK